MTNKLKDLILSGNLEEAKKISSNLSYEELDATLTDIAFHNSSITNYAFVMSLIIEDEKVELHGIAFDMLVNPLCHIDGAYYTALYHAKRCVELTNQQDVGYLTNLLFLHDVPETVVSEKEAFNVAKKILTLDPNNEIANEFMSENRNNK
ncbi:hypothetical protein [Virgibacillus chiguensis]|uniref:Immunity protein 30 n=1 Tax=Virgibacillus chiguensis TaxID=411959 RepID=A0A1M5V685_9BACI|nr:hypothetical protein [Virgibacillus chiguensis]SHH70584.1 hypothetical protein SAMN05421807_111135 [Virgibacillus chiguensis]